MAKRSRCLAGWPRLTPGLECMPDAILILSANGIILFCNHLLSNLLGHEIDNLRGKDVEKLFPQEKPCQEFMSKLQLELDLSDVATGSIELSHKNGELVPIHFRASAIADKERGARGYVVVAHPRLHEEQAAESKGALAKSSDENPFPVLSIDRDGSIEYANRASWYLLADWGTEVGQRVPARCALLVEEAFETRRSIEVELQAGFKIFQLEFVPRPNRGHVDVFGMDITQRKQVEHRLYLNSQIFESAREGIMIVGTDMRIHDVNASFCSITGYEREEILGEPVEVLQDGRQDLAFYDNLWKSVRETGSWQGEIRDHRKNGDLYPKWLSINSLADENGKINRYVGLFSDITTIKQSEEQLYFMAHYDSLTGVANRRYFREVLDRSIAYSRRYGEKTAVMFIDLDAFKNINDSIGHLAGDGLLVEVAKRLKASVRESDTVARVGGDEFTVILTGISDATKALLVAEKIFRQISQPIKLDNREVLISASIGIAIFPLDAIDSETLLRNADAALYQAKERGKNCHQFFSPEMNARALEQLILRQSMRKALDDHEFVVHYQPIVAADTGDLKGLEALVRWQKQGVGLIGPDRFIPLAEETGLISELSEVVLRSACAQGRKWLDAGYDPGRIAINISGHQLRRFDFVDRTLEIIIESGFPAQSIDFEITETVLLDDAPDLLARIRHLKDLGISFSIDDFGTKYSCLAYLKILPIDTLKIDKFFVWDLPHDASGMRLVSAIIAIASSMNLMVIAEGIETQEQAQALRAKGCNFFQGYLYGQAVPAEALESRLPRRVPAFDSESV